MMEPMYSVVTMISALTIGSSMCSMRVSSGRFEGLVSSIIVPSVLKIL